MYADCFMYLLFIVEAAGGKALPCIVDVRDENQISEAVEKAVKTFGGIASIFTIFRPFLNFCNNSPICCAKRGPVTS